MVKTLKDPLSGLIHCIGTILSVAGLVLLVERGMALDSAWRVASFAIFGVSLILLYTASTLYHWLPLSERGTKLLRKFDHVMIFVLIAGTYTPLCLVALRGPWGWSLFGCVWGLALLGMGFKIIWFNTYRWLSTAIYIGMGWLAVVAVWPLVQRVPLAGLGWMLAGGVFYTVGAVIYGLKRPDPWPKVFGFHEIFHIFVLLGSISHFWLIYHYIALL
ncbi:hemolysin III [Hydrogenispora ethanolica]|uniref:Hemolysin III n=1 Tax=Hydrogenispora ethanolica TaxID=1082276 RepID=A0A4R1S568_HYDET|nr:hemolysin III family protein [Hydrogenispora ethanolica]TCL74279.1 hemolysin III [Hydrogenispora ethanolica]